MPSNTPLAWYCRSPRSERWNANVQPIVRSFAFRVSPMPPLSFLTGVKWLIKLIESSTILAQFLQLANFLALHSFLSVTAQQLLSHNQRPTSSVLDCYLYPKIIASTAGNHVSIRSWILQFQETMSINSWCFNSKMCHLTPKLTCLLHTD